MTRGSFIRVAVVALVALTGEAAAQAMPLDTLAIEHATVLPMDRNRALIDHTVLVWRDRIVWVGPSSDARVPGNARRVDGRGAYLIPGLADMHVHTLVAAGLTPYEALSAATVNAGTFATMHLRRAQVPFGTVTPGARADLLLLAADPRADISAVARPVGIVLRGVWIRR